MADGGLPAEPRRPRDDIEALRREVEEQERLLKEKRAALARQELEAKHGQHVSAQELLAQLADKRFAQQQKQRKLQAKVQAIRAAKAQQVNTLLALQEQSHESERAAGLDELAQLRLAFKKARDQRTELESALSQQVSIIEAISNERRTREASQAAAAAAAAGRYVCAAGGAGSGAGAGHDADVPPTDSGVKFADLLGPAAATHASSMVDKKVAQRMRSKASDRRQRMKDMKRLNQERFDAAQASGGVVDGVEDTDGLLGDLETAIATNAARIERLHESNTVERHSGHVHPLFPEECFVPYDGSLGRDSYPAHQNSFYRIASWALQSVVDDVLKLVVSRDVKMEVLTEKKDVLAQEASLRAEIAGRDAIDAVIRDVATEVLHDVITTGAMDVWSELCYVDAVTTRRTEKLVLSAAAQTLLAAASLSDVAPVSHRLMGSYAQLRDRRTKLDHVRRSVALVHRHSTRLAADDDESAHTHLDDIVLSRADVYVIPVRNLVPSHLVLFTRNPVSLALVGRFYLKPAANVLQANPLWLTGTQLADPLAQLSASNDDDDGSARHMFSKRQLPDSDSWRRFMGADALEREPAGWEDPLFCSTLLNLPEVWVNQQHAWSGLDVTPLTIDLPKTVRGSPQSVTCLQSSRCGRYLAAGLSRGGMLVWDLGLLMRWFDADPAVGAAPEPLLTARVTVKSIPQAKQCPVRRISWGRSPTQLVTTDAHGVVRVWSLAAQPAPSYAGGVPPDKPTAAPAPYDVFASFRSPLDAVHTVPIRTPRLVMEVSEEHFQDILGYGGMGGEDGDGDLEDEHDGAGTVRLDDDAGLVRVLDREDALVRPVTPRPIPETATFFANTTLLGHQPSILVACRDGSVLKWSLSFVNGDASVELPGVVLKGRAAPTLESLTLYAGRVGRGTHAPFVDHLESRHLFVPSDAKFLYMLSSHVTAGRLKAARRSRMKKKSRMVGALRSAMKRGSLIRAVKEKKEKEKEEREAVAAAVAAADAPDAPGGREGVSSDPPVMLEAGDRQGNVGNQEEERKRKEGEEGETTNSDDGGDVGVEETKADAPDKSKKPPRPPPSTSPADPVAFLKADPLPDYDLGLDWNPGMSENALMKRARQVARDAERSAGINALGAKAVAPVCDGPSPSVQLLAEPFGLLSSVARQVLDPTMMFSPSRSKFQVVEPLEAHQHPVVFMGYVDPLVCSSFDPDCGVSSPVPPSFITLDSIGFMGLWVYDQDAASPHSTLLPRHVVMLDLTVTQLVPTDTTTNHVFPPPGLAVPADPDVEPGFIHRGREAMRAVVLGPKWSSRIWAGVVQSIFLPQHYPVNQIHSKAKKGGDTEVVVELLRSTANGTLLSRTQQSCVPKIRPGEVLSAKLTKSRRELVVMSLYPAALSEPSLLRIVLVDLIRCKAVPPMIEIPVMDMESMPQMEVTHVHGAVGTDHVIVLVNGSLRVFALSSGLQVNEGEEVPLSAVETVPELRVLHVFGRNPTMVALGGLDPTNIILLALSPQLSSSVASTHRTAMTPAKLTLTRTDSPAWDLDSGHVAFACRAMVLEIVDAVLRVRKQAPTTSMR